MKDFDKSYIIVTHIIFVIISCFTIVMTFNPNFKISHLEKINAWIMCLLYSTYIIFYKQHHESFTNKTYLINLSGVILFSIGFLGYAVNSIYKDYISEIYPAIFFIIGSICFVFSSIIIEKNITVENHVFSLYDGLLYLIGSIFLVLFISIKKQIYLILCLFMFLFARLLGLYMGYLNYKNKNYSER